jgi:hypothetical protein
MGAELELQHSETGQRFMISTSWDNAHFVRGQEAPVQGFTFPENREWEPSAALIQESDQPCHLPLVTVVHLLGTPPVEASTTSATTVEIHSGGQRATIDLKGDQVELTVALG